MERVSVCSEAPAGTFSSSAPSLNPFSSFSFEKQQIAKTFSPGHPLLSWSSLSKEEKVCEVGLLINSEISEHLLQLKSPPSFSDIFNSSSALPPLLQLLLSVITKNKVQESMDVKKKQTLAIGHAILKVHNPRKLSAYLLSTSISLYSVSGSYFVLDLLSSIGFSASYITVRNFLSKFASLHPPNLSLMENKDIVFWADNIQTLCGSSQSSITNTYSVSVVTNCLAFLPETAVQYDPSVDPTSWHKPETNIEPSSFILDEEQESIINHYFSLYLEEIWKKSMVDEEKHKLEELKRAKEEDTHAKETKTCVCGMSYQKSKQICDVITCGCTYQRCLN